MKHNSKVIFGSLHFQRLLSREDSKLFILNSRGFVKNWCLIQYYMLSLQSTNVCYQLQFIHVLLCKDKSERCYVYLELFLYSIKFYVRIMNRCHVSVQCLIALLEIYYEKSYIHVMLETVQLRKLIQKWYTIIVLSH